MTGTITARLLVASLLLVGAGCSGTARRGTDAPPTAPVAEGLEALPARTLSDWKAHANEVVVASVVGEAPISPPPLESGEEADGWLYLGRTVQLRIDAVVWRTAAREPAPARVMVKTTGWFTRDGERAVARTEPGTRLAVGDIYLVALVHFPDGWGTQTADSVFPVVGGVVQQTDSPISASIAGKRPAQVATALAD